MPLYATSSDGDRLSTGILVRVESASLVSAPHSAGCRSLLDVDPRPH